MVLVHLENKINMQKAITIKQPWASLICWDLKDIENRTWKTKFRGRVFVHAGAQWYDGYRKGKNFYPSKLITCDQRRFLTINQQTMLLRPEYQLPLSVIIGEVEIVDCIQNYPSIWSAQNHWHWVLTNPIQYETPISCKGALSFWTPQAETLALCEEMRGLSTVK